MGVEPRRVLSVLENLLDCPITERNSYLDVACAGDEELRSEVERLLADRLPTDDFLERPAIGPFNAAMGPDPPRFGVAEVLAGRFLIERFIGRGGMGEVYEALDLELGTQVALKTLRAGMDAETRAIDQFRREVLRARSVAHANVCRVYDLFAHEDERVIPATTVRFLTMELLHGETLAQRLSREGPLGPEAALSVATQVASAVDEAHRQGVIHCDLKPSNIVMVAEGPNYRAVVTDFGLALSFRGQAGADTGASEFLGGTDGYMAPEQRALGVPGPPADVYAFGVVLHEMLTGTIPSHGDAGSTLPQGWAETIAACLRLEPADRPSSAVEALQGLFPVRRSRRISWAGILSALAVGVALYVPFSRLLRWNPDTRPGAEIVLARFVNDTAEPELGAISELFRQQLRQSPFLNVLEPSEEAETLRRMARAPGDQMTVELAREVAWRRHAHFVAGGRIWPLDRGYALTLRLEERPARPNRPGRSRSVSYEVRDRGTLRQAVGEAATWTRAAAGEARADIPNHDRPVEDVTTSSWEALSLYSRAEELLARSREEDGLALLAEAARLDPDFALAWMRMGDVLMSRRHYGEAYERWRRAMEVSERRNLTGREDYRIRGMFASDTEDFAGAERVYRLYLLSYPNDSGPYFYIARPLLMLGRVDEAISMLEEARRREPVGHRAPAQLAMYCLRAGRLDAAAAHIASLRALGQPAWADCIQGAHDFLNGRYDAALHRFESLEQVADPFLRSRATALQAAVLAERGHHAEALSRLVRGANTDEERGAPASAADKLLSIAYLHLSGGQKQISRETCLRALQLDQAPNRVIRGAALLARAGHPGEAAQWLERLESSSFAHSVRVGRHRVRGEILLARNEPRKAWGEFQKAAHLEAPGVRCEYLARGAEAAGEHGLATTLYARLADDPGYFWRYPDVEPPGSWADALSSYLRLAARSNTTETTLARERYRALRSAPGTKSLNQKEEDQ